MARRSPLNKRYQKDTKVGSTRKSAAAAKPMRSNAGGSSSSSASRSKSSSSGRRPTPRIQLSPEVKRLQKYSFGMLGVAVVLSVLYLWKFRTPSTIGYVIIGLAYGLMFVALYLDFTKVRPALKAAQRGEKPPERKATQPPKKSDPAKDDAASRGDNATTKTDWKSGDE